MSQFFSNLVPKGNEDESSANLYQEVDRGESADHHHTTRESLARKHSKSKSVSYESFSLSPFEKLVQQRRFPCKFMLNVVIFALICVVIFHYELQRSLHDNEIRGILQRRFLPSSYVDSGSSLNMVDYLPTYTFSSWPQLKRFLADSTAKYYSTASELVGDFNYFSDEERPFVGNRSLPCFRIRPADQDEDDKLNATSQNCSTVLIEQPKVTAVIAWANLRFAPVLGIETDEQHSRHFEQYTVNTVLAQDDPLAFLSPAYLRVNTNSTAGRQGVQLVGTLCAPRKDRASSSDYFYPCRVPFDKLLQTPNAASSLVEVVRDLRIDMEFHRKSSYTRSANIDNEEVIYTWHVTQHFDFTYAMGLVSMTLHVWCARSRRANGLALQEAINVVLIVLCIWDTALRVRQIQRYRRFRAAHPYLFRDDGRLIRDRAEKRRRRLEFREANRKKRQAAQDRASLSEHSMKSFNGSGADVAVATAAASRHGISTLNDASNGHHEVPLLAEVGGAARETHASHYQSITADSNKSGASGGEGDDTSTSSSSDEGDALVHQQTLVFVDGMPIQQEQLPKSTETSAKPRRRKRHKQVAGHKLNRHTLGWRWLVWAFLTNTMVIVASVVGLVDLTTAYTETDALQKVRHVLIGISALMSSTQFLSYFRHVPKLYFLIEAMYHAMPRIGVFAVNVLPIFFGYAIFGMIVLGPHAPMFASFGHSCTTLAAVIGGDSLLWIFDDVAMTNNGAIRWIGRFYVWTFICLFIYCALNMMLSIVQDSYYFIKKKLGILSHGHVAGESKGSSVVASILHKLLPTDEVEDAMMHDEQHAAGLHPSESMSSGLASPAAEDASVADFSGPQQPVHGDHAHELDIMLRNGPKTFKRDELDRLIAQLFVMLEAMPNDDEVDGSGNGAAGPPT